jgi:hypothetical protein
MGGIPHVLLTVENHVWVKLRKTTKLMNHLGGIDCLVYVEWLHRSYVYGGRVYHTCGRPPRSKEIGDVQVVKLLVQPRVICDLSWPTKLWELSCDAPKSAPHAATTRPEDVPHCPLPPGARIATEALQSSAAPPFPLSDWQRSWTISSSYGLPWWFWAWLRCLVLVPSR